MNLSVKYGLSWFIAPIGHSSWLEPSIPRDIVIKVINDIVLDPGFAGFLSFGVLDSFAHVDVGVRDEASIVRDVVGHLSSSIFEGIIDERLKVAVWGHDTPRITSILPVREIVLRDLSSALCRPVVFNFLFDCISGVCDLSFLVNRVQEISLAVFIRVHDRGLVRGLPELSATLKLIVRRSLENSSLLDSAWI